MSGKGLIRAKARLGFWRGGRPRAVVLSMALALGLAVTGAAAGAAGAADLVTVGTAPISQPIPPSFLGISMEYGSVIGYEGAAPGPPDPVFAQLVANLDPGQTPRIRIGGDSTDWSWWPVPGLKPQPGLTYALSPSWITRAQALITSTHAKVILGINLEADNSRISAFESRELVAGLGRRNIAALEIGNEPMLYSQIPWYHLANGYKGYGRAASYNLANYTTEFAHYARKLPEVPLAGPSIGFSWLSQLAPFLTSAPRLRYVTVHTYGLDHNLDAFRGHNCADPTTPSSIPSVQGLLNPTASRGLVKGLLPSLVGLAHSHHLTFLDDEMNAVTCAGTAGVSDTFASALWAIDSMFTLARANVDGVNVHTWRGSFGKLFGFTESPAGQWSAVVHPEYYGLLLFAQAAPPGAQLLQSTQTDFGPLRAWATRAPDHRLRVVLIDDSMSRRLTVQVKLPAAGGPAQVEQLSAHGAAATSGVTLGCQTLDPVTTTGLLAGTACPRTLKPSGGVYTVRLPAASAALITIPPKAG